MRQPSGLSATHEEYREARAIQRQVFAFVQETERNCPTQPVLRPSELKAPKLAKDLQKEAMFADVAIFNSNAGSHAEIKDDFLVISQECGSLVRLDTQGSIVLQLALARDDHGMSIIEEDVAAAITAGLGYVAWMLDRIDQTQRLSHVVIVASMQGTGHASWKTRSEQQASPNRSFMRTSDEPATVHLTPPHRVRSALTSDAADGGLVVGGRLQVEYTFDTFVQGKSSRA